MEYTATFLQYIIYFWIIKEFFSTFFVRKRELNMFFRICIWCVLFSLNFYFLNWINTQYILNFILQTIFMGCACYILYRASILKIILLTFLWNIIAVLVEVIIYIILRGLDYPQEVFFLTGSIISKMILIALLTYISRVIIKRSFSKLPISFWVFMLSIPLVSSLIIYFIFETDNQNGNIHMNSMLAAILLLFINMCIFHIYQRMSKYMELERSHIIYEQQIQNTLKQIQGNEHSLKVMKREYHDFKNKIVYIQNMAQRDECEKIVDYIQDYLNIAMPFVSVVNTGNSVLDSLINYKINYATNQNIQLKLDFEIPENLSFDNDALCIIVGNGMDNAIEAVANINNDDKKYIELSILYKKSCLCIIIRNPYEHILLYDEEHHIVSSKKNQSNHGIGLSSIRTALEKFQGNMYINTDQSIFTLKMLLYDNKR